MSKGGFTGKGIFASIPYLVAEYDNGQEKQCNFKREEDVDRLLGYLKKTHPGIPLHSEAAERRLREKQRILEEKKARPVSEQAARQIQELEECRAYLEQEPELYVELSAAAKGRRVYDRSNPAYRWVALFITLMGIVATAYGIYALVTHAGFAIYFLLFGLAAVFLFSGASVLPTAKNNRRAVQARLDRAVEEMQKHIEGYDSFPLPARYAHPIVLSRMAEILAEDRAQTVPEALEVLKKDLKALNSSVTVEQEEFDEIMAIKPMFLVMDYQ